MKQQVQGESRVTGQSSGQRGHCDLPHPTHLLIRDTSSPAPMLGQPRPLSPSHALWNLQQQPLPVAVGTGQGSSCSGDGGQAPVRGGTEAGRR